MAENYPVISIIGIPNTGKSTLFNRIVGKPKALVHSSAGMTRDIIREYFTCHGRSCILQDTGGYFDDRETINVEIKRKVLQAASESDLVLFLFDGGHELMGYERDLYLEVRKVNPRLITVINKIDQPDKHFIPPSYYALKTELIPVSAEHNEGIDRVLERIKICLSDTAGQSSLPEPGFRISFIGKPNVGKSSLINRLIKEEKIIVTSAPGTTRDSVEYELKWHGHRFLLVDNAGIRKLQKVGESTEKAAVIRTRKLIAQVDIAIFVVDISQPVTREDLFVSRLIERAAKPVIIAANKWDRVADKQESAKYLLTLRTRFSRLDFAPVILTSALTKKGLFPLLDRVGQIIKRIRQPIKTSQVNRIVRELVGEKRLATRDGRIFDPKYTVIESQAPFFFRFSLGSDTRLKPHSEKYLKKRIRDALNLEGIPVFFKSVRQ